MRRYRLIRRADAIEDIVAQGKYFADEGASDTALRFIKAAKEAFRALARGPFLGRRWESAEPELSDVRVWHIKGFPDHLIFYRPLEDKDAVEILHVFHGARDIPALFHAKAETDK